MTGSLERGREHFRQRRWGDARAELAAAVNEGPVPIDDLERLAAAAHLVGRHEESVDAWADAHHAALQAGDPGRAVRSAFWLWFGHTNRGEMAQAGGWAGRAKTILNEHGLAGVERGYAAAPEALSVLFNGAPEAALSIFREVADIGEQHGDRNIGAMGRLGEAQCTLLVGNRDVGLALLDEVMVSVTTGDVAPAIVGLVFCAVIDGCHSAFDMRRAREWTIALTRWCDAQPDLVPYRGQCLIHRAELMRLHGEWPDAIAEAERAEEWLSRPPPEPTVGGACCQRAEVHRLRGDFARAEEAYRHASKWGHGVQPGLALLRLAQGQVEAAVTSIRVALGESGDPITRASLLPGAVEVLLAADDVGAARNAADELAKLTAAFETTYLTARAAHAEGAVLLAEADPRAAVASLRRAWAAWRELEAPYEGARARELLGHAYRMLGDEDGAVMELDAARWVFQELGAGPDLARLDAATSPGAPAAALGGHGLTGREIEVLRQLATGKTNRAIAAELVISEKTVARHVANIFTKVGLSSRAGATAYAYEHGLI